MKQKERANTQIAHLVFCHHTKNQPEKTTRAIFLTTLDRKTVSEKLARFITSDCLQFIQLLGTVRK